MTDPTPAKPKGKARTWNKDELRILALFLLIDEEDARDLWRRYAGSTFGGLIDAPAFENKDALTGSPGFWFDIEEQRFAIGRRGYIPDATIQKVTESVRQKAQADSAIIAAQMATGTTDISQFQNAMVDLLKPFALALAAIGRGGIQQIDETDKKQVGGKIGTQLTALQRFARQAEDATPEADTAEKIIRRAGAYVNDAMLMLPDRRAYSHKIVGFSEEQNILGIAEHCTRDPLRPWIETCPEQTAAGWVPIGSLAPIGTRRCLWNCKCHLQYRRAATEQRGVA